LYRGRCKPVAPSFIEFVYVLHQRCTDFARVSRFDARTNDPDERVVSWTISTSRWEKRSDHSVYGRPEAVSGCQMIL
jgi:hypothetical protein